jgi:flagellar motor switch protein FliM
VPVKEPRARQHLEDVQPYDFSRSAISIQARLPGLEVIFSRFARRLRNTFVRALGQTVDTAFDAMDVVLYEDLIKNIQLPSSIHLARLEPLRGLAVFVITARLAYTMIDILFGGNGQRTIRMEGREFTSIETNFLGKFVEKMLAGMEEAWQPVAPLKGRYLRSESNPYHLLGAAPPGDMMLMATYHVDMNQVSADIQFALPLAAIEELREELKSPFAMPEEEHIASRGSFRSSLLSTQVEVQAVVDVMELSLQDIMDLRRGDLLQLHPQELERAELWVEGRRLFRGQVAQDRGAKVFVVAERCRSA